MEHDNASNHQDQDKELGAEERCSGDETEVEAITKENSQEQQQESNEIGLRRSVRLKRKIARKDCWSVTSSQERSQPSQCC